MVDFVHGFYHVYILNVIELKWNVFQIDLVHVPLICSFCDVYFYDVSSVFDYVTWIDPFYSNVFSKFKNTSFTNHSTFNIIEIYTNSMCHRQIIYVRNFSNTLFDTKKRKMRATAQSLEWWMIGSHCSERMKGKKKRLVEVRQMSLHWHDWHTFQFCVLATLEMSNFQFCSILHRSVIHQWQI